MSEEKKEMTKEQTLARFNEICEMFEKIRELDEDFYFWIEDEPEKELGQFCQQFPPEKKDDFNESSGDPNAYDEAIKEFEDQIFYNRVVDNVDALYGELLKLAKKLAPDCEKHGWSKEEFEVKVYNVGVVKTDIDDDKEFDEDFAEEMGEEKVYPEAEKVAVLDDEDELRRFLFG